MCANYTLNLRAIELREKYGIRLPSEWDEIEVINCRYLPYQKAHVVLKNKEGSYLDQMSFSLVPSWSKDPKVKFATHNARIETVMEKPTWRTPFQKNHCLVPLTSFYESAYEGPLAGNILNFSPTKEDLLFAAGIFDKWKNPENGDVLKSFSILTTEPTKFITEYGHDRSPIFLDFDDAEEWLSLGEDPKHMVDFLIEKNQKPELKVEIDRPLKAGWEKRK